MEMKLITALMMLVILFGCSQNSAEQESRLSLIKTTNPKPVQISEQDENIVENVKKDVMDHDEIFDVAVVKGEKDTLVVYKVKHLKRFRMDQIEKSVTKKLEKDFPKENFIVSSDYKIFMEAIELNKKIKDPNFPRSKAEEELNKIIKLKNEQT
jgi:hypothetical protein